MEKVYGVMALLLISTSGCSHSSAIEEPRFLHGNRFDFVPSKANARPLREHEEHRAPTSLTDLRLRGQYVSSLVFPPFSEGHPRLRGLNDFTVVLGPADYHTSELPIVLKCSGGYETWYYVGDIVVRCGRVSSDQFFMLGPESIQTHSFMTIYSWKPPETDFWYDDRINAGSGSITEDELPIVVCTGSGSFEYKRRKWMQIRGPTRVQIRGEVHTSDLDLLVQLHEPHRVDSRNCPAE